MRPVHDGPLATRLETRPGLTSPLRLRTIQLVDALSALLVMTGTMDAYDRRDFERLAELYADDVRWLAVDPAWTCESREDVFELFRARMEANIHISFDEIRATPGHVLLRGQVETEAPFVSVFTISDGRITFVQDFDSLQAAEAALV
jgi:ketosteroid isomerase-like protein